MKVVREHQQFSELGIWTASDMVLFRSDLKPDGAVYTPLDRIPLGIQDK
jgi:2'-5' RNA ligase